MNDHDVPAPAVFDVEISTILEDHLASYRPVVSDIMTILVKQFQPASSRVLLYRTYCLFMIGIFPIFMAFSLVTTYINPTGATGGIGILFINGALVFLCAPGFNSPNYYLSYTMRYLRIGLHIASTILTAVYFVLQLVWVVSWCHPESPQQLKLGVVLSCDTDYITLVITCVVSSALLLFGIIMFILEIRVAMADTAYRKTFIKLMRPESWHVHYLVKQAIISKNHAIAQDPYSDTHVYITMPYISPNDLPLSASMSLHSRAHDAGDSDNEHRSV